MPHTRPLESEVVDADSRTVGPGSLPGGVVGRSCPDELVLTVEQQCDCAWRPLNCAQHSSMAWFMLRVFSYNYKKIAKKKKA